MKYMVAFGAFLAFTIGLPYLQVWAETVNPASNVTADSANTPGTIVLRSPSTGKADVTLADSSIDTAKLVNNTIDTSKLAFSNVGTVDSGKIVCILSGANPLKRFGTCSSGTIGTSICLCQ